MAGGFVYRAGHIGADGAFLLVLSSSLIKVMLLIFGCVFEWRVLDAGGGGCCCRMVLAWNILFTLGDTNTMV